MAGSTGKSSKSAAGNIAQTPADSPQALSKSYSCVVCHKRKVKCDRLEPCSNCEKASVECIYRPPPPPRRRKRERDSDENASQSHEKSRRNEAEEFPRPNNDRRYTSPLSHFQKAQEGKGPGSGRMILKDGNSVFIDKQVPWKESLKLMANTDIALYGRLLAMRSDRRFQFS